VVGRTEGVGTADRLLPCDFYDRSCIQSIGVGESKGDVQPVDEDSSASDEGVWEEIPWWGDGIYNDAAHVGAENAEACARTCDGNGGSLGGRGWGIPVESGEEDLFVSSGGVFGGVSGSVL